MSLEAINPQSEQKETVENPYHIIHSNVDGAGLIPGGFGSLEDAKKAADRMFVII